MKPTWYKFRARGAKDLYGYGTRAEALAYADHLNKARWFNFYVPTRLSDIAIGGLRLNDDDSSGFVLSIALHDVEAAD